MSEIKITLPDGSELTHQSGVTVEDVAYSIGKGLGRAAVAGVLDGEMVDLKTNIDGNAELSIITRIM